MGILSFFRKPKPETRASASGFTAEIMAARESYISGRTGIGELTATVQACVTLWEGGLSLADVEGTEFLTPATLAIAARSLALRGEAVFLIGNTGLIPCSDWDVRTRDARSRPFVSSAWSAFTSSLAGACSWGRGRPWSTVRAHASPPPTLLTVNKVKASLLP